MWAAKLVLEVEPKWFREFCVCDRTLVSAQLEVLTTQHKERKIEVLPGDFNETVYQILDAVQLERKQKHLHW